MRRVAAALSAVATIMPMTVSASAVGTHAAAVTDADVVAGRYIVVLRATADLREALSVHRAAFGVEVTHLYRSALLGYAARMDAGTAAALARRAEVAWVEPDRIHELAAQTLPTGVDRVDADRSSTARIDGVDQQIDADVAVLDTGIDLDHPDLNVFETGAKSCVAAQPTAQDLHGHGTHVAGTIGALDNTEGVVGVAPGARLWPVKVMTDVGAGLTSDVLCGIEYVTQNAAHVEVVNMSIGSAGVFDFERDDRNCGNTNNDAYHRAICSSVAAGVTYVVAGGNDHKDAKYQAPAAYDEVITVSALADYDGRSGAAASPRCGDEDDTFANFSNFGADVDLIAPGDCIYSTLPLGGYGTMSGTSMASPHVAGAAALYAAVHPNATPLEVKNGLVTLGSKDWIWPSQDGDGIQEPLLDVDGAAPTSASTPTPTPTPTPTATPTPTPTGSPRPTPTSTASSTPTQTSPTPTPGAGSASPSPRATPTASPAPDPDEAFYPTKVTLTYRSRDSRFQGTVASPSARCERGREVVLKKKRPGKDRIVALDITDRTGRWKVGGFVDPEGAYYAVAKTKGFVTNDGDLQSCARDRSRTLHR